MKHAYLIMAHNEFDILKKQLCLLDDPRNDIYVHIDKKVKNFPFDEFRQLLKFSNIHFVQRIDARWGDFSLVKCELILLKAAIKGDYRYYHLLSGVDMPLKSNNEIHSFFNDHDGLEFVHFCSDDQAENQRNHIERYHSMRLFTRSNSPVIRDAIRRILHLLQYKTGFRRRSNQNIHLAYGSQWFSITHRLAEYILSKEKWIKKHFSFTCCSDEHFLQTLILDSNFSDSLFLKERNGNYLSCMRYIDWTRGNPYVFRSEDFRLLIDSPYLFARKFSTKTDDQIIAMLYEHIRQKNGVC